MSKNTPTNQSKLVDSIIENREAMIAFFLIKTRCPQTAEDLYQDLLIKALKCGDRYTEIKRSFIYQMARSILIDKCRKDGRRPLEFCDLNELSNIATEPSLPTITESDVREALKKVDLTRDEKECASLHLLEEMTCDDIASLKSKPRSTIGGWILKAKKRLASYLS